MPSIEATLFDLNRLEDLAARDTPMRRVDPRAKTLTTLLFLATVASFPKYSVAAMLPLLAYPAALLALGNVPLRAVLRPMAVAFPFVFCIGVFNPLFDQVIIARLGNLEISGGWLSLVSILLRFALSVSAALLLIATTGFYPACLALQQLGTPRVFVTQLLFLNRYLFVLGGEACRVSRAHTLRAGERQRMTPRVFAAVVGNLLLRAMDRAHRIHTAMLSRGFDGCIRLTRTQRARGADYVFFAGWGVFFLAARLFNLAELLGEWTLKFLS